MANTTKTTKVATPKANTPAPVDTVEALGKAIGARYAGYDVFPLAINEAMKRPKHKLTLTVSSIKLTTTAPNPQTYEGTLFTACPILNLVAINTRPTAASDSGDYHIIPVSRVQNFQITSLASQQQPSALPPVDTKRLKDRETARIAQLKDQAADRGKGVSKEAQAIYDALKRV
jgi:hypothetical protein